MKHCIELLKNIDGYAKALENLERYSVPVNITGPSDSQKGHISFALCKHLKAKGVYVTYNETQARRLFDDLSVFFGEGVLLFPAREIMLRDVAAKSSETEHERIKILQKILREEYEIIVTSAEAFAIKLVSPETMTRGTVAIELNSAADLSKIITGLSSTGYERVDRVDARGQFAVRGGILDVFPVDADNPARIEWFGDEPDSMRIFDMESQRSIEKINRILIPPALEVFISGEDLERLKHSLEKEMELQVGKLGGKNSEAAANLLNRVQSDIENISQNPHFSGIDRYIPQIIGDPCSLADYTGRGINVKGSEVIFFLDERARIRQRAENILLEHFETCVSLMEKGEMLPGSANSYFDFTDIMSKINKSKTVLLNSLSADTDTDPIICPVPSKFLDSYRGHIGLLAEDLSGWVRRKYTVVIFGGPSNRGEHLKELLHSKGLFSAFTGKSANAEVKPGEILIARGSIGRGFEYTSLKLVFLSEADTSMLPAKQRKKRPAKSRSDTKRLDLFAELTQGDFVVHSYHGIGLYAGIEQIAVDDVKRDYIKIKYGDGDYLYVPGTQLDLLQKYIGAEGKAPRLSKLGGNDWTRTKRKVSESLKELAAQLTELYAKRQAVKGYAFSPDMVWQSQFEDTFPYEETEDQLRCIEEIKGDMESERPADRLLCGDVGYGKTEVAIRAAFKAVMDSKQVAYLVPTTVLGQQHFNTFKERMKDYPVTIEMLSRFRTPSQQKKIQKNVKNGNIDILIGTHRILQKDVQFKDLGLLIVDEEQRFGVIHKERIKKLSPEVDVLTLTATPIPRTLHMSLVGIRDISVLEQPPEERYPVQTYVMEFNEDVVREAILKEIARSGQVFYLSNRVMSIEQKAQKVRELCPDARVATAHGQMEERALEDVMIKFIAGEYDVLVCTTIIESGLDLPNVNTIIVENSDSLGLAQLYQIRGRVGRSNRLAYAYITYKKDKILSETAEKRLQAIKEFTEFGSGFKIAMRDLEIRGAGNLLGPEQHGHIATVGYEMYCRLLEQAVREMKGEPEPRRSVEVTIDINISAYIDSKYIGNEAIKIEMYKKIASIEDEQDVLDIRDELMDRFGEIPAAALNLIDIAYIKSLAGGLGIISVSQKGLDVTFFLGDTGQLIIRSIGELLSTKYRNRLLFDAGGKPRLVYKLRGGSKENMPDSIKKILLDIKKCAEH
ncbi:MAG: transcription-repair coupling factor [Eubacteriales bacterium]|nr:transcription-repair coupling factor [Eubacteriales bacterium]